jgi:hypothetical protein
MAKVHIRTLSFVPSASSDVVAYRLYIDEGPLTYNSITFPPFTETSGIDLGAMIGPVDGIYNIGVSSIDDAGNESDILEVASNYPLDFIAPDAPTGGVIS